MNDTVSDQQPVVPEFGAAAAYYDEHAIMQMEIAERLIASLQPWKETLPSGPVIELGCGTGFVSRGLLALFPGRTVEITDMDPRMVDYCRRKLGRQQHTVYRVQHAEEPDPARGPYALSISGFAAQWFRDPARVLGQWLDNTKPGGLLLASFPGSESFPEWKTCCRELGIPFTGNALPDTEEMVIKLSTGPAQVDYYEDMVQQSFASACDFFAHLKRLGAGTQQHGRHLSSKEMRRLIDYWDDKTGGNITVSYHIVFLAIKRDHPIQNS